MRQHHYIGNGTDLLVSVFINYSLSKVEGLERSWGSSCLFLAFANWMKMTIVNLGSLQRIGHFAENAKVMIFC